MKIVARLRRLLWKARQVLKKAIKEATDKLKKILISARIKLRNYRRRSKRAYLRVGPFEYIAQVESASIVTPE